MGVKNRSDIGEIQVSVSGCQEPVGHWRDTGECERVSRTGRTLVRYRWV